MKYFSIIDELFDFSYLMTEDVLRDLPTAMLNSEEDTIAITSISSELDPSMELPVRTDRNLRLYISLINRLSSSAINTDIDSDSKLEFIDTIIKNNNIDTLITNPLLATIIIDHKDFKNVAHSNDFSGLPYPIGTIGKIRIIIDPFMEFDDTTMILYSKKDIRVAAYIKSADVEYQGLSTTKLVSTITSYLLSNTPIQRVKVKLPNKELI